jgi:hypothetical protein
MVRNWSPGPLPLDKQWRGDRLVHHDTPYSDRCRVRFPGQKTFIRANKWQWAAAEQCGLARKLDREQT